MGTYVYLTTATSADVDLQVVHVGPETEFDDHYHLSTQRVGPTEKDKQVMEIDRGGDIHFGDAVGVSELQLWISGVFVGALQVMLDNSTTPVKDAMNWTWRTPQATGDGYWTEARVSQNASYQTDAAQVEIQIREQATGFFDDLYVTVKATVTGYRAVAAIRDPRRKRALAFALDTSGAGVFAQAPLLPAQTPSQPAWQSSVIQANQGAKLVGDPTILRSLTTTAPTYLTARTDTACLWLTDADSRDQWQLPIAVGGAPLSSLTVGAMWQDGAVWFADVFATAGASGQSMLYHNVLRLSNPPKFVQSAWDNWKTVLLPPSYAIGETEQYLFALMPATLGGQGIYYCSASLPKGGFGMWHALPALPKSATALALAAFTWHHTDMPQDPAALVCAASDNKVYGWARALPNQWEDAGGQLLGPVQGGVESNVSPLVARSSTGLVAGYGIVKEVVFNISNPVPNSAGFKAVAILYSCENPNASSPSRVLVVQRADGRGPLAVPFETIAMDLPPPSSPVDGAAKLKA